MRLWPRTRRASMHPRLPHTSVAWPMASQFQPARPRQPRDPIRPALVSRLCCLEEGVLAEQLTDHYAVDQPPVSILIVNFNGAKHLPACLIGLEQQTVSRERFEVVLVDNASTDGSADLIRDRF